MSGEMHKMFSALGDKTRLVIVERLLEKGEASAGDLVAATDISAPAVSRHLKVLTDAGLIARRIDKQRRIYSANPVTLRAINQWTMDHEAFWSAGLDRLEQALEGSGGD